MSNAFEKLNSDTEKMKFGSTENRLGDKFNSEINAEEMTNNSNPQFVVPQEKKPSYLRRLFRRTLYLRLLDGEFILWCFETGRTTRRTSDFLRDPRVVVSDTQAFANDLLKAMNDVGVGSIPGRRRILILHSLRFPGEIAPTEKYALHEMWKNLGSDFFVFNSDQKEKFTDSSIVTLCDEVGALKNELKKV